MARIETLQQLEAVYGAPSPKSLSKVAPCLTPHYRRWIEAARFCVLATVGPEGVDASPRGDDGPVVRIEDDRTLLMPDWRGNNRTDSLQNIVRDGRVSLMFMVPGSDNVVRIIGQAELRTDPELTNAFSQGSRHPRSVIRISISEVYFQCAKALMRSKLWSGHNDGANLPTAGDFLREQTPDFDAESYDRGYPDYAKTKMW